MKTRLLFLSLIAFAAKAQSPVQSFYGTNDSFFAIIGSTVSHTTSGANVTWNFTGLTTIGQSIDSEAAPTAAELTGYPTTTTVTTTTSNYDDTTTATFKIFSKAPGNTLSITGIDNGGLILKYNTNNATLGTFPLEYGYSNTDNVAGNYDNGAYAGTFTGTLVTTVDGWGTLNVSGNPNVLPFSGTVTRLKTLQTLSLNYGIFTNVGTVTVTSYSYYPATGLPVGVPAFRSTTTTVNVPLLSIDQTLIQNESYSGSLLGTTRFDRGTGVVIAPNPVQEMLKIESSASVKSVKVSDALGKIVLHENAAQINVAHLAPGIYFAAIETDRGTTTQKFLKK